MKSSNNNNNDNPYGYVDAVISDIGHSIKHEEEEEKNAKANNIADPPNFRPIIKRKYSSGKLSSSLEQQHDNNNIIDHGNPTISNNNRNKVTTTTFSFDVDTHPDDESSTFIRAKNSRFILYIRRKIVPFMHRIRNYYNYNSMNYNISNVVLQKKNKMMNVRKLSLICLILLTFIFMNFGYNTFEIDGGNNDALRRSTTTSSSLLQQANTNNNNNGGGSALQLSFISGYQAKSQVPIPMEYTHFVELSEFVDAVTLIRIHREQTLRQQQQQEQNDGRRRRRLDEDNNKEEEEGETSEAKEEENEEEEEEAAVDNAIDKAWEEAVHKNPELEQQQQIAQQQQQQEQTNMLMVHHVPFFWHIPRTGGTTISTLLSTCHTLVQASSSFTSPLLYNRESDDVAFASRFRDPTLYVVRAHHQQFVNVDLDSYEGVQRAINGKLIESELADVVVVPDVRLGSLLFGNGNNNDDSETNGEGGEQQQQLQRQEDNNDVKKSKKEYKGVLFAMFRHPIDRAVSEFYNKQNVKDSVHFDQSLGISSLQDYVNSPSYVTNYMVRALVGKIGNSMVPLVPGDLDVAKEILRRKCIIGLLEEKGESMKRFDKFFGWRADVSRDSLLIFEDEKTAHAVHAARWSKNVKDEECSDKLLHWNWMNKNKHPMLEEGTVVYNLLESKNRYDLELYMYARQLFEEQFIQLGFDDDAIDVS